MFETKLSSEINYMMFWVVFSKFVVYDHLVNLFMIHFSWREILLKSLKVFVQWNREVKRVDWTNLEFGQNL